VDKRRVSTMPGMKIFKPKEQWRAGPSDHIKTPLFLLNQICDH